MADAPEPRLGRPLPVLPLAIPAAAAAGLAAGAPRTAQSQPGPRLTDADPQDPPGQSRGIRPRTGLSDADPHDPPADGRGR